LVFVMLLGFSDEAEDLKRPPAYTI